MIWYKKVTRRLGDGGRPLVGYVFMYHLPFSLYWPEGLPPASHD